MRLRAIFAALAAFLLLSLSVAAMPPQETQDVAFSPNPVPIHACSTPLITTDLTITGTKWAGHHVQHDVGIAVSYVDGSQRSFGLVDIPQGGNWQTTIPVDCGMPYQVNGQWILDVVLIVHDVNANSGLWHYFVPVVWVSP